MCDYAKDLGSDSVPAQTKTKQMNYTKQQLAAAHSDAAFTMAIACPGSGKTRTLIHRIERLVEMGIHPRNITLLSFTNAAADEIVKRARLSVGELFRPAYAGTLHGYILRLISSHGHLCGISSMLSIIDEDTKTQIVEGFRSQLKCKASDQAIAQALRRFATPGIRPVAKEDLVAVSYHRLILGEGLCDFDTLLSYGVLLARKLSLIPGLSLGSDLMVDEVQDSGEEDAAIYLDLPFRRKFLVGDPNQSIYRFRGANPKILRSMLPAGTLSLPLSSNFRSKEEITAAADSLLYAGGALETPMFSERGPGGLAMAVAFDTDAEERFSVAKAIKESGRPFSDFAVILRTNPKAAQFAECLSSMGVPVKRQKPLALPADWQDLRKLVAFFSAPDNNLLAFWYYSRTVGSASAEAIRKDSQAAFVSMTAKAGFVVPDVRNICAHATRFEISRESAELVEKARIESGAQSYSDLSVALSQMPQFQSVGEGVHVGTVHSSKGHEWPIVWMPAMWSETRRTTPDDYEEERRIAYVGFTRAADILIVSYPRHRKAYEQDRIGVPADPSAFIADAKIPPCTVRDVALALCIPPTA